MVTLYSSEWDLLTRFVGLFASTALVKGQQAQSLLLVGSPGVGKSEMIERFIYMPNAISVMDLTFDGMRKQLFPRMIREGRRVILYPELYKMFQRKDSTASNALGLLTQAMSGELRDMYIGNEQVNSGELRSLQVAIIGGMPTPIWNQLSRMVLVTGLRDRMAVLPMAFSQEQTIAQELAISLGNGKMLLPVRWRWPEQPVDVQYDGQRWHKHVLSLADMIQVGGNRNRLIVMLVGLLRAAAMLNGRQVVTGDELRLLETYFLPLLRALR